MWRAPLGALFVATLTRCSGPAPASNSDDNGPTLSQPIPGFVMTFKKTKCRLGGDVTFHIVQGGVFNMWSGTSGQFEFAPGTQQSFCTVSPPPGSAGRGPDVKAEVEDVEAYFIAAGMPRSQIGSVDSTYSNDDNGAAFSNAVISRVVDGVQVADSHAWAGLVNGKSLGELVYWPELPASVSQDLAELRATLADPRSLAAFQAKLPSGILTGSIVVHHTSRFQWVRGHPAERVQVEGHACYDAVIAHHGLGVTHSFLPDGTEWTGYVWPPPADAGQ